MRFESWMAVALASACSCGADPAGAPGATEPVGPVCLVLDPLAYPTAADVCAEQADGSVPAACFGDAPAAEQCEAFRVRYRSVGDERYYCCCNPRLSTSCDFAAP